MQISNATHTNFGSLRIAKPCVINAATKNIIDTTYTYVKYPPFNIICEKKSITECLDELAADISLKFTKTGKAILGLTRKLKEVGKNGEIVSTKNLVLRDSQGKQIIACIDQNTKREDLFDILNSFRFRCEKFLKEGIDQKGPNEFWRNYPTAQTPGHKIVPDTDNEKIINAYKNAWRKGIVPVKARKISDLNETIRCAEEQCGIPRGIKFMSDVDIECKTRYEKTRAVTDGDELDIQVAMAQHYTPEIIKGQI